MKIRIADKEIDVINTPTHTCRAGKHWTTAYVYQGATLAAVHSGPSHEPPAPLDLLNATRTYRVTDYDTPDAETHTGVNWDGQPITWRTGDRGARHGIHGDRKAATLEVEYTIREKIEWALAQIVD